MSKEFSLKDFDLYQKMNASGASHIFKEYVNTPLLNFTKAYVVISDAGCKKIGINKESRIITANKDGVLYVVNLPFDSKLLGYKKMAQKGLINPTFTINSKMKHKFKIGIYEILEPIFVSGMDFFELKFFEKQI
jgi:hypothetical protein